jgi:hypothetical protein
MAGPSQIPNVRTRKDKNSLPDRAPRFTVGKDVDQSVQLALTRYADTLDSILKYLNDVLGASK